MKKIVGILMLVAACTLLGTTASSCSRKTGCPAIEKSTKTSVNKAGMPKKKAKSGLFPKKMKKKRRG